MRVTDSILVSVNFDMKGRPDTAILLVGRKKMDEPVDIINHFQGEEAMELYKKLTGSEKKKERDE